MRSRSFCNYLFVKSWRPFDLFRLHRNVLALQLRPYIVEISRLIRLKLRIPDDSFSIIDIDILEVDVIRLLPLRLFLLDLNDLLVRPYLLHHIPCGRILTGRNQFSFLLDVRIGWDHARVLAPEVNRGKLEKVACGPFKLVFRSPNHFVKTLIFLSNRNVWIVVV